MSNTIATKDYYITQVINGIKYYLCTNRPYLYSVNKINATKFDESIAEEKLSTYKSLALDRKDAKLEIVQN